MFVIDFSKKSPILLVGEGADESLRGVPLAALLAASAVRIGEPHRDTGGPELPPVAPGERKKQNERHLFGLRVRSNFVRFVASW
jgi:hypothetical protein